MDVPNIAQAGRRGVEGLLPARLPEHLRPVVGIDHEVLVLLHPLPTDEGLGEPVLVLHVVEAIAALHAQPVAVRRAAAPLHPEDPVVLYVVGEQAADPAVGADGIDGPVGLDLAHVPRRHEGAGGAGLHAFTAGDAGGVAHGIVEVEHDLGVLAAKRIADDVVDLLLPARPHATPALDAGIEVRGDGGVGEIRLRLEA